MIWILEMMMYMLDFLKGDKFVPFGETDVELMEEGELIYSVGDMVKLEDGYGDKERKENY